MCTLARHAGFKLQYKSYFHKSKHPFFLLSKVFNLVPRAKPWERGWKVLNSSCININGSQINSQRVTISHYSLINDHKLEKTLPSDGVFINETGAKHIYLFYTRAVIRQSIDNNIADRPANQENALAVTIK